MVFQIFVHITFKLNDYANSGATAKVDERFLRKKPFRASGRGLRLDGRGLHRRILFSGRTILHPQNAFLKIYFYLCPNLSDGK